VDTAAGAAANTMATGPARADPRATPGGKSGHGAASALAQLLNEHQPARTAKPGPHAFAHNPHMTPEQELVEAVRQACIQAALDAYEDAGISGLCAEGRWEAAISAIQSLDIKRIATRPGAPESGSRE
jgi:hypothetical protein